MELKFKVGDFACLKVVALSSVGAFLNWDEPKDLLLPFAEQTADLVVGQKVVVAIYEDNTQRPAASMRLNRFISKEPGDYFLGQKVTGLLAEQTDLGYKAIIENKHWGLFYNNEVFKPLEYGQIVECYITKLRPDGKIDLNLNQMGHKAADKTAQDILDLLKLNGGFLAINDKSDAEQIYKYFGVSKKKFKIALGGLYKQRLISISEKGTQLLT